MDENNQKSRAFPESINEVTPTPDKDALSITGLIKADGKISGYQLSDGENVSKEQGVQMTKENRIKGVAVAVKNGTEYLRTLPDNTENNNLGNLPSISKNEE
jgi:hypothetical protein